jgi:hypothetical protein
MRRAWGWGLGLGYGPKTFFHPPPTRKLITGKRLGFLAISAELGAFSSLRVGSCIGWKGVWGGVSWYEGQGAMANACQCSCRHITNEECGACSCERTYNDMHAFW